MHLLTTGLYFVKSSVTHIALRMSYSSNFATYQRSCLSQCIRRRTRIRTNAVTSCIRAFLKSHLTCLVPRLWIRSAEIPGGGGTSLGEWEHNNNAPDFDYNDNDVDVKYECINTVDLT